MEDDVFVVAAGDDVAAAAAVVDGGDVWFISGVLVTTGCIKKCEKGLTIKKKVSRMIWVLRYEKRMSFR